MILNKLNKKSTNLPGILKYRFIFGTKLSHDDKSYWFGL